jgi:hypothetical protein
MPVAEDFIFLSGDSTFEAMDIYPVVLAHEMGHFSQRLFSTLDSPGGAHGRGDYEDQTLSWIEGSASAIAALTIDTPFQNRTASVNGQIIVVSYDVRTDLYNGALSGGASLGWYSEDTIARLIWTLYEPNGSVRLPPTSVLAPMFSQPWRAAPWLNTVWAFLAELKQSNPVAAAAIDAVADPLNISATGNDVWGSLETHPGNRLARDVLPPYAVVRIGDPPVSVCSAGQPLEYNKAGNVRYLRLALDGNSRTLTVQGPSGSVPILNGEYFVPGSDVLSVTDTVAPGDYVVTVGDCAVAAGEFASEIAACNEPSPPSEPCWSVTLQ